MRSARYVVPSSTHSSLSASMVLCGRCHRSVYDKLAYCPYCGAKNTQISEGSDPVDVRKYFRIFGDNFYIFFVVLSGICAGCIILYDIFCNILDLAFDVEGMRGIIYTLFYISYFVQVSMFTWWVYTIHKALRSIKVSGSLNSAWAFSMYLPGFNLYFPAKLIYDFEDVLYHLKVRGTGIRNVGIWWTLWVITAIYPLVLWFFSSISVPVFIEILFELIWAGSIIMQAAILNSFRKGVAAGIHKGYDSRRTYSRR